TEMALGNALVTMYGRCGVLDTARLLFDEMGGKDTWTWNSMITAYAQGGREVQSLELWRAMQLQGVDVDEVTFVGILSACSHGGILEHCGICYFGTMLGDYGITPIVDHYICMVDVLGRVGKLDDAEKTIELVPKYTPDAKLVAWTTLLNGCRMHHDFNRGMRVIKEMIQLDVNNASPYVMLSNM
ncbi:hypothetical protein SELMODRAFT_72271, partial [Selaginella moellendorffii]